MSKPLEILKQYWGYDSFRPMQEEIIDAILGGEDTLGLLPTGGGKSICFQVPGLTMEGLCLVVSPLIALMKDQVMQLKKRNISAAAIYSGMSYREIDQLLDHAVFGHLKFLYLSPERLLTELAIARLQNMKINIIAVDEAHCISQWGYDFRPAYLKIAELRKHLPKTPILALTATATPEVVKDIQEKLLFKKEHVFQRSFARPNLSYTVLRPADKVGKVKDILTKVKGTAVVYVRNRRKTKEVATYLHRRGLSAHYYHAGLSHEERHQRQMLWMENKIRIMVSTNAFGMGIDKPDVRTVVHLDLPESLESYFQEAGRAGRDGKKAYAVLLYNEEDAQRLRQQFHISFPDMALIQRVYQALGSYFQLAVGGGKGQTHDFQVGHFCKQYTLEIKTTYYALKELEQAGWISLTEAVFTPASLQVMVDKDELYDFQLKHPQFDKLLKTILRTYQGAFQHHVYFKSAQLARFLKISEDQLKQYLTKLQQENILDYRPQKELPQLTFLHDRVATENLTIDYAQYEFRKTQYEKRMVSAIQYAEKVACRSQQLLHYFGEMDSPQCGICDVCLGRTKVNTTVEEINKLQQKIKILLKRERLSTQELVESFSPKWEPKVLETLQFMVDEGHIADQEGKFHLLTMT